MPVNCVVKHCLRTYKNSKTTPIVAFHRIPPDPEVRRICGIAPEADLSKLRICSEHFDESEFIKNTLTLKRDAVPTIKLPQPLEPPPQSQILRIPAKSFSTLRTSNQKLRSKVKAAKLLNEKKTRIIKGLKNHWQRRFIRSKAIWTLREKQYKDQIRNLKSKVKEVKEECLQKIRSSYGKILSLEQMRMIENEAKMTRYSTPVLSKCISLYAQSRRAYDTVREIWNLPIPCFSTIRNYCNLVTCEPGVVLTTSLKILQELVNGDKFKSQCILGFDEIGIKQAISYDQKTQSIIGPHNKMTVIGIRSLLSNLKIPIHFDFNKIPSKDVIFEILRKSKEHGLDVRGIVNDMGGPNWGLWKELGANITTPAVQNPNYDTPKLLHIFADPPHSLKLLWLRLLERGITLEDGTQITSALFQEMLELDSNELKLCYKITKADLEPKGFAKMNCRKAFQFFSRTVAAAIRFFYPHHERIAKFFERINDGMDLLNSRYNSTDPIKAPLGTHLREQMRILDEFDSEIRGMRVGKSKTLMKFQTGLLMTVQSFKSIFHELRTEIGAKYLLGAKCNQDYIENWFSVIRAMGGASTNPNTLESINRLKLLIISRHLSPTLKGSVAVESYEEEPDILKSLIAISEDIQMEVADKDPILNYPDDPNCPMIEPPEEVTASNWTEFHERISQREKAQFGGQEYIAGYIANKLKEKHPELLEPPRAEERNPPSWSETLSTCAHQLTIPSIDWVDTFRKMEVDFTEFHSNPNDKWNVNRGPQVIDKLITLLKFNYDHVPIDAIKLYAKTRTFIRIKHLNKLLKDHTVQYNKKLSHYEYAREIDSNAA